MALPTLRLTYFVKESEKPGVYIGRINELSGIFAQANSLEEVKDDLIKNTYIMLQYKRDEAIGLLRKQLAVRFEDLLVATNPEFEVSFSGQPLTLEAVA